MKTNSPKRSTLKRTLFAMIGLALIVTVAVVTLGVAQQTTNPPSTTAPLKTVPATSPTFGQQVDSAVDSLKKGANDASRSIKAEYEKARDAIQSMGTEARVYSRLHWDKDLTGATLSVTAPSTGVIALSGTLASATAKTKAIRLAEETVGVTKVLDQLTVTVPTAP